MNAVKILFKASRQSARFLSTTSNQSYKFLNVIKSPSLVTQVELNRPDKRNALNNTIWMEIGQCFDDLAIDPETRAIVLTGAGKAFCAGIDFTNLLEFIQKLGDKDISRKALIINDFVRDYQDAFTKIELCPKPVIAAVHGMCIGAGVSIITACDIRYATDDAEFCVKEIDLAIIADVGALQRLPKIVGNESKLREWLYTASTFNAKEALDFGLVSATFNNKDEMTKKGLDIAAIMATKSPVCMQGTKKVLNYCREHTIQEGLDYVRMMNMAMLQSEDVMEAAQSVMARSKDPPKFNNV